jgi:endonuclease/exonuclease/phosphatase (EEP) superfamily protein YafD
MSNDTALGRPGSGRIVPWFSRVAIGLSIATSAATVAGRFGQFAWPLELMSHFAVQLLAFQVIGLALLLVCRRQRIAALFLPFALVNALVVAPYAFVPTWRAEAAPGPTRLVVLSANIHYERHKDQLLRKEIERVDPDVILLIEPSEEWISDKSPLRARYRHVIFHRDGAGTGIMIASRIPWERAKTLNLSSTYSPSIYATFCPAPERGPAGCVDMLGVHPISPIGARRSHMRDAELQAVAKFVNDHHSDRFVVLGDFNTTPWSVKFSELLQNSGLSETPVGRGLTATWMSKNPLLGLPIDHILVGRDVQVAHQEVGQEIGSEHYPISAVIAF